MYCSCHKLLLLSFAALVGCQPTFDSPSKSNGTQRLLSVSVAVAEFSTDVAEHTVCYGNVAARRSSTLGFARGGQVSIVNVDIGSRVSKDQVLAELEQKQIENQRDAITRSIASTKNSLTILENNPNVAKLQQQVTQARQRITRLENQLKDIELELAKGRIVAPFSGVIAERRIDEGDSLPTGSPALRLLSDESPVIEANLVSTVATTLQIGSPVSISINEKNITGTVATIAPEIHQKSRTQLVTIALPNETSSSDFTIGLPARLRFQREAKLSGVWIPYTALQQDANGMWYVYVAESNNDKNGNRNIIAKRFVDIVTEGDDRILVSKLQSGDQLLIDGLHRVVPGQRVTIDVTDLPSSEDLESPVE